MALIYIKVFFGAKTIYISARPFTRGVNLIGQLCQWVMTLIAIAKIAKVTQVQHRDMKNPNVVSFDSAMIKKPGSSLTAILSEIKTALHNLLQTAQETIIDLNNTPCDEQCEERLKEILGKGEVSATLTIFGCDQIQETNIHGVWWVRHINNTGAILTKSIYISYVPSILPAQREDVEYSITVLERRLANTS